MPINRWNHGLPSLRLTTNRDGLPLTTNVSSTARLFEVRQQRFNGFFITLGNGGFVTTHFKRVQPILLRLADPSPFSFFIRLQGREMARVVRTRNVGNPRL